MKDDSRLKKISNMALTVGGLASSTKGNYYLKLGFFYPIYYTIVSVRGKSFTVDL